MPLIQRIDQLMERLSNRSNGRMRLLPVQEHRGIGHVAARVSDYEIDHSTRSVSAEKSVAYIGFDSQWEESRKRRLEMRISKQDNLRIRWILYGCVTSAQLAGELSSEPRLIRAEII